MTERPEPQPVFHARVLRIVDADTIVCEVSKWHGDSSAKTIRLLGVDAPELRSPTRDAGIAARDFVVDWMPWILSRTDHSWPLTVQTASQDSFGRWLGRIFRADTGEELTTALLAAGHGAPRSVLTQLKEARS